MSYKMLLKKFFSVVWIWVSVKSIFIWFEMSFSYRKKKAYPSAGPTAAASSVARGGAGGLEPPIGLWNMQNRTFLVLLRPIFGEKLKTAPPQRKLGDEVVKYMSWFGLKKRLNAISVKTFFFFLLETICFWAEKTFEFPSFPRNSHSVFGQTVWFWFKNNENSGQGRLHFSHSFKKAPLFQILATRLAAATSATLLPVIHRSLFRWVCRHKAVTIYINNCSVRKAYWEKLIEKSLNEIDFTKSHIQISHRCAKVPNANNNNVR